MTGLEAIQDQPEVREYLLAHGLRVQSLIPGWEGWDTPHMMSHDGAIIPTSPAYLMHDVRRWKETGNAWHVSMAS